MWVFASILLAISQGCSHQATFQSPNDAAKSLADAERNRSETQLNKVFGPSGKDLLVSRDPIQDRNLSDRFVQLYDEQHELVAAPDGSMTLTIGKNEWPFPIPIVKDDKAGTWMFDTDRGKDELINRRVGRNELSAIQVCMAIIDAERDFVKRSAAKPGPPVYATKFISKAGQQNGLYWETKDGQEQSPLGPLVAEATEEGYQLGHHQPYHGYYYRIITAQGPHANHGAYDYMVDGKLIGGVAILAWPAEYGKSGVMTFITNHEGTVYQRDLGKETEHAAKSIKSFDPEPGWRKVN